MTKERLSNIELLRIAAILLIVSMHVGGVLLGTTNPWNRLLLTAINAIGNMGVTIFVLISGFFGIRFRWSRLLTLWLTALFYSLFATGADLFSGTAPTASVFFTMLTPVTSRRWWFLSCYVILMCLAPVLNYLVEHLSRRQLHYLLGILLCFFVLSPTLLLHPMTDDAGGKGLANMLTAYLIGRYLSRYGFPSWIRSHSPLLFAACFLTAFIGSYAAGCIHPPATLLLCKDNNVLMLLGATAILSWTLRHPFHSPAANWLAGFAFPLYLSNLHVIKLLQPYYVDHVDELQIWGILAVVMMIVVVAALLTEMLRRVLLDSTVRRLATWIDAKELPSF